MIPLKMLPKLKFVFIVVGADNAMESAIIFISTRLLYFFKTLCGAISLIYFFNALPCIT